MVIKLGAKKAGGMENSIALDLLATCLLSACCSSGELMCIISRKVDTMLDSVFGPKTTYN